MNKKIIIALLVIILLLTILCLKITLVEFFSSNEKNLKNLEKEVRKIFKNCSHINDINFNDIHSLSMSELSKIANENTISGLTDCYENLTLKDQTKLMGLFINHV